MYTWNEIQPIGDVNKDWTSLGMSRDKQTIITGYDPGRLYLSKDAGVTWNEIQPAGNVDTGWRYHPTLSDDGSVIIISSWTGTPGDFYETYMSTDGGSTWSMMYIGGLKVGSVPAGMDSTGNIITVAVGKKVYLSEDKGSTWTQIFTSDNPWTIQLSGDGNTIFIGEGSTSDFKTYVSTDRGANFTATPLAGRQYAYSSLSYDGLVITCVSINGSFSNRIIELSTDQGTTFSSVLVDNLFTDTGVSDTGQIMVVTSAQSSSYGYDGTVRVSRNGGLSFDFQSPALNTNLKQWAYLSISGDGNTIVVSSRERLYMGVYATTPPDPVDPNEIGLRRAQMRSTMDRLETTDPTVTDDKFNGFGEGDTWYNTVSKNTFICLDSTVGAAVWEQKPGGGGIPEAPINGVPYARKDAAWSPINYGVSSVNGQVGTVILTPANIGLGNVDNTSDVNKPVSTATQSALNLKAEISSLATVATTGQYSDLIGKPTIPTIPVTSVNTKTGAVVLDKNDIGLGSVDDTSDADKPVSSATQIELNLKANSADLATVATTGDYDDLSNRPLLATVATTGLYSDLAGLPTLGTMAGEDKVNYIEVTQKGAANGVATLDATGKVPASQLDISSTVVSVNAKTGVVVLDKTDIGLSNIDNTSDINKPISTATQAALNLKADDSSVVKLTGAQTIAGIKTFTSSPIVPTPTTDYQAVTKKYVDDSKKPFTISINFIDLAVTTIKAPSNMKINSITSESGAPTIKVGGTAYTLGTTISQFAVIEVTATVNTLVILNSEKI